MAFIRICRCKSQNNKHRNPPVLNLFLILLRCPNRRTPIPKHFNAPSRVSLGFHVTLSPSSEGTASSASGAQYEGSIYIIREHVRYHSSRPCVANYP